MSHPKRHSLVFCLVFVSMTGIAGAAHAFPRHVTLCNKSNGAIEVAWGYDMTGTTETRSAGWKAVPSCGCKTLFSEDVRTTEFFLYVTTRGGAIEDSLVRGSAPLCVRSKEFTHRTSNVDGAACTRSGGTWVKFRRLDASAQHFTTNFGSGGNCVD
jgi:uncharacterized membrane protein